MHFMFVKLKRNISIIKTRIFVQCLTLDVMNKISNWGHFIPYDETTSIMKKNIILKTFC